MTTDLARHWSLDPNVTFLNHGSFGATPIEVLRHQAALRAELEANPVRFLSREIFDRLDVARAALAAFVGADSDGLVFVPNATTGVNAVVRSLSFAAGDELLVTNHGYRACTNALAFVAGRAGARVVVVDVPFPLASAEQVTDAILARVTPRTRLALLDHVTSPTALVFPIARLVAELTARGVETLVDGAHAPGMVPLDLRALGATYYAGNCHKWLCSPKGAGFLYVRPERRDDVHPVTISHGATATWAGRSRYHLEFDWAGTSDPTAYLSVPKAIDCVGGLVPGGWPEVMQRNRDLAREARRVLCDTLRIALPCLDEMVGSLAAVPLPDGTLTEVTWRQRDPLQARVFDGWGVEVPVHSWPRAPRRLVRVSAQLYNGRADYVRLAEAIAKSLEAERSV
ncbi:MAG: aminotransferase class V-fold PLP-dependent enzyme [Candidatus Rokubacteria bacterium]|nr:aminotransferase class V-fold PLP-dependent enzyme [Candidatus Rokubacteria bacterium]